MNKKAVVLIAAGVVLAAVGYWIYEQATWVEEDLEPLAAYAKTQRYEALATKLGASPPGPEGFCFVVLGDTRSNYGVAKKVMLEAAKEQPALILNTGDIVRRGTVEEYIAHHLALVDLVAPIPVIPVPGNHEDGPNGNFAAFKALYGDERFSIGYGDCRFVGVNNADGDGLSNDDLAYIERELAQCKATYKFVMFHVPPRFVEEGSESEDGRGFTRNADDLHKLMVAQGVNGVFLGHLHGYATRVRDGVYYTITGGGGAPLSTSLGEQGNVHNYVVVRVKPDGLEREVVRLVDGEWVRGTIP